MVACYSKSSTHPSKTEQNHGLGFHWAAFRFESIVLTDCDLQPPAIADKTLKTFVSVMTYTVYCGAKERHFMVFSFPY